MTSNPPAFPGKREGVNNEPEIVFNEGMTLRDYFASQALAVVGDAVTLSTKSFGNAEEIAQWCYRIADAMLEQREKT